MKTRIIHTKFYQDSYILELQPLARWFFLYLISNEKVEKTGAYELSLKVAAIETGLSTEQMTDFLEEFHEAGKIFYVDGYVVIKNILKYQDYSKGSDKQVQSYNKELNSLPQRVREVVTNNDLTSYQLVTNQLPTSPQLVINNKRKIINNNTRGDKGGVGEKEGSGSTPDAEEVRLIAEDLLSFYNRVYKRNAQSVRLVTNNLRQWLGTYSPEEMKRAILYARTWERFGMDFDFLTFFRTRNKNGECDYWEGFLNKGFYIDPTLSPGEIDYIVSELQLDDYWNPESPTYKSFTPGQLPYVESAKKILLEEYPSYPPKKQVLYRGLLIDDFI